jgi:type IV pilus assembly protein PilN
MIRINLLRAEPKDIEAKRAVGPIEPAAEAVPIKKKPPVGYLAVAAVAVLLAVIALLENRAISTERERLAAAQGDKHKLEPVLAKLDEVEQQKAVLERKIGLIGDLKARQGDVIRFMEELSTGLPEWVWLNEATFNRQGIQVKGRALTNILISDYMRSLENSGLFDSVALLGSTQRNQGNTIYLEFSLAANFVQAPSAKPAEQGKAADAK